MGVVLFAGEHAPEQDGELAGDRDDRVAVPAAGRMRSIEGVQRAGLRDRVQAASTSAQRADAEPCFEIRPRAPAAEPDW